MKTYKVHKSDYSKDHLSLVQDLMILGKQCDFISNVEVFQNYYNVTSVDFIYKHFQTLINS